MKISPPDGAMHSSDVIAECDRAVYHRWVGEIVGEMGTKLMRGNWAHHTLTYLHRTAHGRAWTSEAIRQAIVSGYLLTESQANTENRPITAAAITGRDETAREIESVVSHYAQRCGPYLATCTLVGCELPCEWRTAAATGYWPYRTHIDLLMRDSNGCLVLWDWKWHADPQPYEALSRNHQFALMYLAVLHGQVCIAPDLDLWERLGTAPLCSWIDLGSCKSYARRTTVQGVEYAAGDDRPLDRIIRTVPLADEEAMIYALLDRQEMYRAGFFPRRPGERCTYCDSRRFCQPFTEMTVSRTPVSDPFAGIC